MKVNEKEEVSMEVTYHQVSSRNMIDTTIDRMDASVDINKNTVLQKGQPDSVSIEKQQKQATNTSRNPVKTAFLVSGIILVMGLLLTSIGAITMADPHYPVGAGLSPFLYVGVLLVLVFGISFIIAIIMLVVHEMKSNPTSQENK